MSRRLAAAETIHTPPDRHLGMLPREKMARTRGITSPRQPALWDARETFDGPPPKAIFGAYPKGFLAWALRQLRCAPSEVLHVCSGMMGAEVGGVRVDIRREASPNVQADGRRLPFRDGVFGGVLIDPPYSVEYAQDLYGTTYPRPSHLLGEASRVVVPGGRVGFLHFLVPFPPPGCALEAVRGVTTGCGYRIRAWSLFRKEQSSLPGIGGDR